MKALVLGEDRALHLAERPVPDTGAAADLVVVRVVQTGICGTDRGVLVGKFHAEPGVIMGHESIGVVHAVGSAVRTVAPGDRVVVNPTLYCGWCPACVRGELNFCQHKTGNEIGIDRDGGFAEYLAIEERFVFALPADVPDDRAVLIEPLACVLNNLDAAGLTPGSRVTVLGAGPIGIVAAMAAAHFGCPVTVLERDEFRRSRAAEVLKGFAPEPEVVSPETPVARGELVLDTVGNLLAQACDLAADLGTVVIMGFHAEAEVSLRPLHILQRGLRIVGAGDYNSQIFPRAVALGARLPLERLVTHRFALDEHEAALRCIGVTEPGYSALKVVIEGRLSAPATA
ncbi:MAG TPA: alcohol dehydrogenase catalytic domain-containing protein [Jatrophihabitans sp.]|nr:alcohol dehydrogenase catalytic domain-containing protein [Jatrophihabitans sp.]